MKRYVIVIRLLAALSLVSIVGYSSSVFAASSKSSADLERSRNDVRSMANATLQRLYAKQPDAKRVVEHAAGYAVFSTFGMKILVAGGGSGKGLAMNNKTGKEIFMRMVEVQAGLGFSIKKSSLIWVFETQGAFNQFVDKGFEFGGQATLAAKASGEGGGIAGAASVSPGVWVYQLTNDGLAADLTVKGTKYYRDKKLN